MARWKSGLLPLFVFANSVNWDTQRISPSMSLMFCFHICPAALEKTLSWSLHVLSVPGSRSDGAVCNMTGTNTHSLLLIVAISSAVSSVLAVRFIVHDTSSSEYEASGTQMADLDQCPREP